MDTKNQKRVPLSQFEAVAAANGYEVFTKEEIADYARENLMKSRGWSFIPGRERCFHY